MEKITNTRYKLVESDEKIDSMEGSLDINETHVAWFMGLLFICFLVLASYMGNQAMEDCLELNSEKHCVKVLRD